jgi:PIN domain nuclease of toxin-antitoxin system
VAIKRGLGRSDFRVDPRLLRRGLLENGYVEISVTGEHAIAVDALPPLHEDLFDRLLVAQSMVDSVTLLTTDAQMAAYPAPVRMV